MELARALYKNTTLSTVDLRSNPIGDHVEGVAAIATMLTWHGWSYKIATSVDRVLVNALYKNSTLETLNLDCNLIGVEGASSMSDMLQHITNMATHAWWLSWERGTNSWTASTITRHWRNCSCQWSTSQKPVTRIRWWLWHDLTSLSECYFCWYTPYLLMLTVVQLVHITICDMNCTHSFFSNYYKICAHTILTLCIENCNVTNRSTKILFS